MANYNYGRFIGESIESVLGQTYSNWELIVCDDGSTDNSIAVIESYAQKDRRIRWVGKKNEGHASALNRAFGLSAGQLICLLDSDDLFLPEKLKQVVECSRSHNDSGFLVHRVLRVREDRRREGVWPLSDSLPEGWYGPRVIAEGGVVPYMPPTSGLALRREIAEQLFPLPVIGPLRICPDQVLMRTAPLLTAVAKVPGTLTEFRLHGTNTYGARRTTAETLTKEIDICKELWKAQCELLRHRDLELAKKLKPIETSPYFLYLQYLRSKLSRDKNLKRHYSEFMAAVQDRPTAIDRFWRYSLYLPTPVFAATINLLLGQSALKQLLAKLNRVV
jgi:glycosyltransferase involved in cell wall biosynthesis